MSYTLLGDFCQRNNGAPFQAGTKPVQTVLLSNYGGVGYSPSINPLNNNQYQCDGKSTLKNAYAIQSNPYASAMCGSEKYN
jgi:hypothetical protein